MLVAIYAATTVRDPMAKRVKALNDRREQLKAGITASTNKRRAKLGQSTETADRMRSFLQSLRVLQDTQVKQAQIKLAQAGIRSKDWALAVIFGRHGLAAVPRRHDGRRRLCARLVRRLDADEEVRARRRLADLQLQAA